jgi:hypothetical protein
LCSYDYKADYVKEGHVAIACPCWNKLTCTWQMVAFNLRLDGLAFVPHSITGCIGMREQPLPFCQFIIL